MRDGIRYERIGLQGRVMAPPRRMDLIHHHPEMELNYIFRGGVTYLHQWRYRKLSSGQLAVFWGSPPHSLISFLPGTEMAWITLPLPWVLQWKLPAKTREALLDGRWCFPSGNPRHYPFRDWVREIQQGGSEALLLELQACLLRLNIGPEKSSRSAPRETLAAAGGWKNIELMARFAAEHFTGDIGVKEIAMAARLHPKYAMQLFRRYCGVTLRTYLERHRLTHSQRLLITTGDKIIEIAHASGFNSLSAFYERFEKSAGCSPRVFRKRYQKMTHPGASRCCARLSPSS